MIAFRGAVEDKVSGFLKPESVNRSNNRHGSGPGAHMWIDRVSNGEVSTSTMMNQRSVFGLLADITNEEHL